MLASIFVNVAVCFGDSSNMDHPCQKERVHWESQGLVIVDPAAQDIRLADNLLDKLNTAVRFRDLVQLLGPAYVPPCSGTGIASWTFVSGKRLRFPPSMVEKLDVVIELESGMVQVKRSTTDSEEQQKTAK